METNPMPAAWHVRLIGTALAVAALAHVPPTGHHLAEAPYMGAGFVLFTVGCLALLLGLSARPGPVLLATVVVTCAGAIGVYAATRLVAFPGLGHDVGAWTDPLGLVAVAAEAAAALAAFALLTRRTAAGPGVPARI